MREFLVYRAIDGGLVCDVQTRIMSDLKSRLIVPLIPFADIKLAKGYNVKVTFDDHDYVFAAQYLSSVETHVLKMNLGNLKDYDYDLSNALDFLFQGF